ncbi:unnamed protein product [Linum tenue]|uniref:tRNA/rRNA methyltransferase SpoU type domain-containing protein n=1 Tax=Linum tenue TaxID=586396 RepID=A0AAV0KDH2_9ROSI|nr:unnamed protein product [Linum tenue]
MQSAYTSWVPLVSPSPPLKLPITKVKLATVQRNSNYARDRDDGDGGGTNTSGDSPTVENFTLPAHVKSITSTSNPFVRHCVKLSRSSPYRHSHGSTLVVGTTPIREISKYQQSLPERTTHVDYLFLLDNVDVPAGLESSSPARTLRVSSLVMKKLSQVQSTESIEAIALMRFPTSYFVAVDGPTAVDCSKWFPSPHRILVLEGIQDPGNLGTLLRSAVAFKWGGVFLLPGCCDPFNGKALRASRGASFQVPIVSGTWHHLQALINEFDMRLLAGHPDIIDGSRSVSRLSPGLADSLSDTPLCLVLGNEAQGLTEESQRACELVSIPMARDFESLNVAVAGGIFLYMLQPHL